jgi:hypothetical protein
LDGMAVGSKGGYGGGKSASKAGGTVRAGKSVPSSASGSAAKKAAKTAVPMRTTAKNNATKGGKVAAAGVKNSSASKKVGKSVKGVPRGASKRMR